MFNPVLFVSLVLFFIIWSSAWAYLYHKTHMFKNQGGQRNPWLHLSPVHLAGKKENKEKRNRSEGNSNGMGMKNRTNRSRSESLMEVGRRKMLMMIKQKSFILNNTLNYALCLLFARLWVCLLFFLIDTWFYSGISCSVGRNYFTKAGKIRIFYSKFDRIFFC